MLEAQNIVARYGSRTAVDSVSLTLSAGQITALIGPNGAGKSTLLRTLNGGMTLVAGFILLNGKPLEAFARREIAKHIAVVAQESDVRFPVTVLEFVLGGRYAWAGGTTWGWESVQDVESVSAVLRETSLLEMRGRLMNELSGGERQRSVLARALATEATHLLLDEPTANLDLSHQATILSLVRSRCNRRGVSALVITHDINLAAEFADNVLLLKDGRSLAYGPPQEVFRAELIEQAFAIKVLVDQHPMSTVPRITPVHEDRRSFR